MNNNEKSICYCSNWDRATHKSNDEHEELPSALCNSTVSPGSKCNSWNWQTLKWSNLREFCSQQELEEGNRYFEASAGSKIEKLTNHQICNESLADPLPSPVKPDTAWGALVTPRNAVGALQNGITTTIMARFFLLLHPLLTGVSAVKTPVSRSRYPPAQFVRL